MKTCLPGGGGVLWESGGEQSHVDGVVMGAGAEVKFITRLDSCNIVQSFRDCRSAAGSGTHLRGSKRQHQCTNGSLPRPGMNLRASS